MTEGKDKQFVVCSKGSSTVGCPQTRGQCLRSRQTTNVHRLEVISFTFSSSHGFGPSILARAGRGGDRLLTPKHHTSHSVVLGGSVMECPDPSCIGVGMGKRLYPQSDVSLQCLSTGR